MSDSGEKTEEPTDKKIRDARKKGDLPQSKNTIGSLVVVVGMLLIFTLFDQLRQHLGGFLAYLFENITHINRLEIMVLETLFLDRILPLLITLIFGLAFLTVAMTMVLNKFNLSFEFFKLDFKKFNPVSTIKNNIFSMNNLYNMGYMLVYAILLFLLLTLLVRFHFESFIYSLSCGAACIFSLFGQVIKQLIFVIIAMIILLVILDVKLQRKFYLKKQRMTKEEVKKEHIENDWQPIIKQTRNQIAQEIASGYAIKDITFVLLGANKMLGFFFDKENPHMPVIVAKFDGERMLIYKQYFKRHKVDMAKNNKLMQKIDETTAVGYPMSDKHIDDMLPLLGMG